MAIVKHHLHNNKLSTVTFSILLLFLFTLCLLRLFFMYHADLLVEEAYYWNYARHLDFSYLDHPPMVALLVKTGTLLFGNQEWGVRFATFPCWLLTMYFCFKLANRMYQGAGLYAIFLLSILPFFFIHSLIITPDIPLILSWSASLYFLYLAVVCEEKYAWYWAGIWLGLGLLSKYTIVLIGAASFCYLILIPSARKWFLKKEPYLAAMLSIILFTPVLYWNATHEWASFVFQSTRRFQAQDKFSTHLALALLFLFLTPAGIVAAWKLFTNSLDSPLNNSTKTQSFIRIYTAVPLGFFIIFSLFHTVKLNWMGPALLAIIPWLAILLSKNTSLLGVSSRKSWALTAIVTGICYAALLLCIATGKPKVIHQALFNRLMPWDTITQDVHRIANAYAKEHQTKPVIVPLDLYNIGSELAFYQQKQLDNKKITSVYNIVGAHIFGSSSLMYQYWGGEEDIQKNPILLISAEPYRFNNTSIYKKTSFQPPLDAIQINHKNTNVASQKLYFKIVHMKIKK